MEFHLCFCLLLVSCFLSSSSQAYKFHVGGKDGWVISPSEPYNHWAERNRFQVNDTLYFKYKKGEDSVLHVHKNDYYNCNTDKPIKKMDDGDSKFRFHHSGPFFFISGIKDHCKNHQQKIIIVVLAVRYKSPTPVAQPPAAALLPPSLAPMNPYFAPTPSYVSPGPSHVSPISAPVPSPASPVWAPGPSPASAISALVPSPASSAWAPTRSPTGAPPVPTSTPPAAATPTCAADTPTSQPPGSLEPTGPSSPSPKPMTPTKHNSPAPAPAKSSSFLVLTPNVVVVTAVTAVLLSMGFA